MFTSKISELINKEFLTVLPIVCLDSLYYECASSSDNATYRIDRQTAYKHLTMLVNKNIGKSEQEYTVANSTKASGNSKSILLNDAIQYSTYNSSYVQLTSKCVYNLGDILYNFATLANFNSSYNNASVFLYNLADECIEQGQQYIDDLSTHVEDLSVYAKEVDSSLSVVISDIDNRIEYIKNIVDTSIEADISTYNNSSIAYFEKEAVLYASLLRDFLNNGPEEYRFEMVYTWEEMQLMMQNHKLITGKTYNVLYYPRTTLINKLPVEHYKFSIPIVFEVIAISDREISNKVKVKNSVDALTTFTKNYLTSQGTTLDDEVLNFVNVYSVDDKDLNYYTLKPIFLRTNMQFTHLYDDLYGTIVLNNDGSYKITSYDISSIYKTYTCSRVYILTLILLKILEVLIQHLGSSISLLNDLDKSIVSEILKSDKYGTLAALLDEDYIKQRSISLNTYLTFLSSILERKYNDKITDLFYIESENVFLDLLKLFGISQENFIKDINAYVSNNIKYIMESLNNVETAKINIDSKEILDFINNLGKSSIASNIFNIYYDTFSKENGRFGLLYNGTATLYSKLIELHALTDPMAWIYKATYEDYSAFKDYPQVLLGGKNVPYDAWDVMIDNSTNLCVSYLKDDKNNIADYDFRALPTFITEYIYDDTSILADEIFWQTYYYSGFYNSSIFNKIQIPAVQKFEVRNNIILNNTCNAERKNTYYVTIPYSSNPAIINSVFDDVKKLKPDINVENIEIKNNTFSFTNEGDYSSLIGFDYKFINNDVSANTKDINKNCTLYQLYKSSIIDNSINFVFNADKTDPYYNASIYNSTITNCWLQNAPTSITNSRFLSSIITTSDNASINFSTVVNDSKGGVLLSKLLFSSLYGKGVQAAVNTKIAGGGVIKVTNANAVYGNLYAASYTPPITTT